MSTNNNPVVESYLFFNGQCEEALDFYKKKLGAKVDFLMRYKDSPEPPPPGRVPPGFENKIMHCSFQIGATRLMASDGCSTEKQTFEGFSLSLTVPNEAEAEKAFTALSDGGQIHMPLAKTFWTSKFGMVQDKFGIGWMVAVAH